MASTSLLGIGVVAMLGACGTNPIGRMLESEGAAPPIAAEKAMNAPRTDRQGFPADDDAPVARPNLAGKWVSGLADPLVIEQDGDRVTGRFDRNGFFDCAWNGKSRFNCTWKSDAGEGLGQLWWNTDRPAGVWMDKKWGEWGEVGFQPWNDLERVDGGSSTTTSGAALGGACNSNQGCADPDTRCMQGTCKSSVGTKCSTASDCSPIGNRYDCKRQVCTPR